MTCGPCGLFFWHGSLRRPAGFSERGSTIGSGSKSLRVPGGSTECLRPSLWDPKRMAASRGYLFLLDVRTHHLGCPSRLEMVTRKLYNVVIMSAAFAFEGRRVHAHQLSIGIPQFCLLSLS